MRGRLNQVRARYDDGAMSPGVYQTVKQIELEIAWTEPQRRAEMTTTIYDYVDLLAELQAAAPEAQIAGGAVRDTLLEKPIHDIDVFMEASLRRS